MIACRGRRAGYWGLVLREPGMGGTGPFTPSFTVEILQGTDVGLDVRVLVPAGRGQGRA